MAIIKPYSAYTTNDTSAENFPALAYAWTSDYGFTPGSAWVDRIHGASIGTLGSSTLGASGAVVVGSNTAPKLSGVSYLPGTTDMIIMSVGYIVASKSLGIGSNSGATQAAYVANDASGGYVVSDASATNYVTTAALGATAIGSAAATPGCMGLMIDWNGDAANAGVDTLGKASAFKTTEAGVHTLGTAGTATNNINAGITALTTDELFLPAGVATALYGIYVLYFTSGVPSDSSLKAATQWMVANPTKGLYPGWAGRE